MASSLQLASITLRVPDLDRSLAFYADRLGFTVKNLAGAGAELAADAAGPAMLNLVADRSAPPASLETAGLFHVALLLRDRPALGAWLRRAGEAGVEFDGFADHGVSDALYLTDPDGNGLEIYADRPRATWPRAVDGELAMFTHPLDLRGLMAEGATSSRAPLEGARWGHLHLRVTQLARSEAYYRKLLGLDTMQSTFPGARFLAADGYHHHLGLNTWSRPQQPRPLGALGLAEAVFRGSRIAADATTSDPDGISLRLETGI